MCSVQTQVEYWMPLFVSYVCSHSCLALFSVPIILAVSTAQQIWSHFEFFCYLLINIIIIIIFAVQLEISVELLNNYWKY